MGDDICGPSCEPLRYVVLSVPRGVRARTFLRRPMCRLRRTMDEGDYGRNWLACMNAPRGLPLSGERASRSTGGAHGWYGRSASHLQHASSRSPGSNSAALRCAATAWGQYRRWSARRWQCLPCCRRVEFEPGGMKEMGEKGERGKATMGAARRMDTTKHGAKEGPRLRRGACLNGGLTVHSRSRRRLRCAANLWSDSKGTPACSVDADRSCPENHQRKRNHLC